MSLEGWVSSKSIASGFFITELSDEGSIVSITCCDKALLSIMAGEDIMSGWLYIPLDDGSIISGTNGIDGIIKSSELVFKIDSSLLLSADESLLFELEFF